MRHNHTDWETRGQAGDTTPEPASQHLASDRRDWEIQGQAGDTTPEPASQPLASAKTGRHRHISRDNRETRPQDLSHKKRETGDVERQAAGDTGRQAGDTTPEPASQRLASDRRDWETQPYKRDTRPRSRRHSIWHATAAEPASQHLERRQAGDKTLVTKNGRWET